MKDAQPNGAVLASVTDDMNDAAGRAKRIKDRALRLHISNPNQFAKRAPFGRETLTDIWNGDVGSTLRSTFDGVEQWLTDQEEIGDDVPSGAFAVKLTIGDIKIGGVEMGDVVAEGNDPAAVADSVARLIESARRTAVAMGVVTEGDDPRDD